MSNGTVSDTIREGSCVLSMAANNGACNIVSACANNPSDDERAHVQAN